MVAAVPTNGGEGGSRLGLLMAAMRTSHQYLFLFYRQHSKGGVRP
jgi:hypothetical protein